MDKNKEEKYPEPVVGALIINREGKIFLAKSPKWSGKYTIPGGHVHEGEKLDDAIIREVKEETGLDVEITGKLDFSEAVFPKEFNKKKHFIYHHFICLLADESQKVEMNDEFENEYHWFTLEEAKKADALDSIHVMLGEYEKYLELERVVDSWKRCQADFENYKKNQVKAQEEFRKFAKMDVVSQLLPVLDNFNASLDHVPEENKENGWVEGIVYIKEQLEDVLKNNGIEEIDVAEGDEFNPEIHEAVSGKGEKIKKILQKGYKIGGMVVRAARVEVS